MNSFRAARIPQSKRVVLPVIPHQLDALYLFAALGQRLNYPPTVVGAAVIDQDDFISAGRFSQDGYQPAAERLQ